MPVRTITLYLVILFSFQSGFSQEVTELEKRKGFKDIKLEMVVDSVKGIKLKKEFKEKDEFPARLYAVEHPAYTKIGEVRVEKIELKAYKGLVYEISVIADKDPRLMKALESLYGKADYDLKAETYFWKTETMILKFRTHGKHHLELLYNSYTLFRRMKEDKEQKVNDIANDF